MMHARIYLAPKARTIHLLPLFTLPCFSEKFPKSWGRFPERCRTPSAKGNAHRLWNSSIGWGFVLSATNPRPVGTLQCRLAKTSCRNWFLTAIRTDSVWHGISSKCMHGHTPYHARDSREHDPQPSGHQSCILMRDGLRSQGCNSM